MGLLESLGISASALNAQRLRMDVIAHNVANVNSTRGADGGPFRRQVVSFKALTDGAAGLAAPLPGGANGLPGRGVGVDRIDTDQTPGRRVYDPSHPDADADGFVETSNVDLVVEMTDMVSAVRAYEASVTALNAAKTMAQSALDLAGR